MLRIELNREHLEGNYSGSKGRTSGLILGKQDQQSDKQPICAFDAFDLTERMTLEIDSQFLVRGRYSIHSFLHVPGDRQFEVVYDQLAFQVNNLKSSYVIHGSYNYGSVFGRGEWISNL